MKTHVYLSLFLLLTACSRQERSRLSPNQEMGNKLSGTWVFEPIYTNGDRDHKYTTTVALDGSYLTTIEMPHRKLGPRIIRQEGTWRVEDGFLIEVLTKDSQTNTWLPITN